jgi:hypothetical protein
MRSGLIGFSGLILPFGYISKSAYKHIGIHLYKPKAICGPLTQKNGKMAGKSLHNHCRLPALPAFYRLPLSPAACRAAVNPAACRFHRLPLRLTLAPACRNPCACRLRCILCRLPLEREDYTGQFCPCFACLPVMAHEAPTKKP